VKPLAFPSTLETAKRPILLTVIVLVVGLVYANSLNAGFVWDDASIVVNRGGFFSEPSNAWTLLSSEDSTHASGVKNPYYRPLNTLAYMLDYHLWGHDPFWYHLENLLLHALTVVLLFLVVEAAFTDRVLAFVTAILFAVYPVNSEAVSFVSARNNLLCVGLLFASLLALTKCRTHGRLRPLGALLLFFLALMSKESAVVTPFFLASLATFTKEPKLRAKGAMLLSFFAILLVYFGIRFLVLDTFTSEAGPELSIEKLRLMAAVYFENFRLILYPFRLNASYTQEFLSFSWFKAIAALAGLGLLVFFSVWRRSPEPIRVGLHWVFWGLLLVSNLIAIPSAPVAERYLYAVVPGVALVAAYLLREALRRNAGSAAIVFAIIAVSFGVRAFARNQVWTDDLTLDTSMLRSDPSNAGAHMNLGITLSNLDRMEEGERALRDSIRLNSSNARAHYNLATLQFRQGRLAEAMQSNETAIRLDPSHAKARSSLGVIYTRIGRNEDAARELEEAVRLEPGYAEGRNNLGMFYGESGRLEEALAEFQQASRLRPDLATIHRNLATAYMKLGRGDDARRAFERAAELDPRYANPSTNPTEK
jgi:Flp pilus assembly protein TadD